MSTTEQAAEQGTGQPVWFDALAHTVTVDGDWPRCAECGEYGAHEDCQPEAMTGHPERTGHADLDAAMSTHGEAPQPGGAISASMVAALESAWSAIRVRHPEVPAVVIVLGGGSDGRPGTPKLGHFAALRWIATPTDTTAAPEGQPLGEVFVGGEGLARRPVEVLGTLLHEAAHALADVRGIKDTSRQGRWHNARFKALAEELGIEVSKDPKTGWSPTTVTDPTVNDYVETLTGLSRALRMQRAVDGAGFGPSTAGKDGEGDPDGPSDTESKRKPTPACVCRCGRRIRVAPTVFALGPIVCGLCERPFRCDGGDQPEQGEAGESGDDAQRGSDEHDDVEQAEVAAAAGVAS